MSLVAMLAFVHCGDEGPEPALKLNETELSAEGEGGSMLLGVASNISWSAISSEGWCVLENYTQKGDGSIILRIAPNTTGFERSAKITVSGGSLKCEATVKQAGSKSENGGSNEGGGSQGGETPGGNEGNGSGDDGGNTPTPTVKYPLTLGSSPSDGGTVSGGGSYDYGTSVTLKAEPNEGYLFSKWSDGVTTNPRTITVSKDMSLTASFEKKQESMEPLDKSLGKLNGKFSVSATKQVSFSMGNLQYQASTNTWRFSENQYDIIGKDNVNISSAYSGWIDLFGWGTSGYNSKYPYMTSTDYSDYGNGSSDISGTNYDWGVYNAISNGGGKAGMWRTLTEEEWNYLYDTRANAENLRGQAIVIGQTTGYILLPDGWSTPSGLTFTANLGGYNRYSASEWSKMEAAGAVFLPCADRRGGTSVSPITLGNYWSSTYYSSSGAYYFYFDGGHVYPSSNLDRHFGLSVRLVQE